MLDKKSIGERLKNARLAKGMNRSQFAEGAKIDISQYSKAERGIEGLGPDKLGLIASCHGINIEYIASGSGEILQSLNNKTQDGSELPKAIISPVGSLDLLSRALADQAEASKIQAAANDKYASGFALLASILERMENKMAREDTLADVALNLQRVFGGLETVGERQEGAITQILSDLREIKEKQKVAS